MEELLDSPDGLGIMHASAGPARLGDKPGDDLLAENAEREHNLAHCFNTTPIEGHRASESASGVSSIAEIPLWNEEELARSQKHLTDA